MIAIWYLRLEIPIPLIAHSPAPIDAAKKYSDFSAEI